MRFTGGSKRAIRVTGWRIGMGVVLVAVAATAAVLEPPAASGQDRQAASQAAGAPEATVALSALPAEARSTHELIRAGGPFPYSKDGTVFGNRERLLPGRRRGDYREYTVPTPQSRDRGARRIVCAGTVPSVPEACYYTDDHYASFRLIAP